MNSRKGNENCGPRVYVRRIRAAQLVDNNILYIIIIIIINSCTARYYF